MNNLILFNCGLRSGILVNIRYVADLCDDDVYQLNWLEHK